MSGPHPSTAAVRGAVRAGIADLPTTQLVLVACSGGADSLALAEALAFVARHQGRPAGAVIVDHGLQPGSGAVADAAATTCRALGLNPVLVRVVRIERTGAGLEADARVARYAALEAVARETGATVVLLGHTRDDQAEQVLLGLTRGAGARSLSGMPPARGRFRRPLLGIGRDQTRGSCAAERITWWDDPMNADPAYGRVRARRAIADLERDLGPGIAAALARSAEQLRADADLLDELAAAAAARLLRGQPERPSPTHPLVLPVAELLDLPRAVRTRVWRRALVTAGAPAGQLSSRHTDACEALLTDWHGQGPAHLPGNLRAGRAGGAVTIWPDGSSARGRPPTSEG